MEPIAKILIYIGAIILFAGLLLYFFGDNLSWFGKLPGDFQYKSENVRIFFPFVSMLLLSLVISILIWLFRKMKGF